MIPGCEIVKNLLTKKTTITECKKYMLFENIIVIHQDENVNLSIYLHISLNSKNNHGYTLHLAHLKYLPHI